MAPKNVKDVVKVSLAELAKRVPLDQALQFQAFQAKYIEYQERVSKHPEKLPAIDWDFYRRNVRTESKHWVDQVQQKYKSICESFDARQKQDYSKYYVELENARCEMEVSYFRNRKEQDENVRENFTLKAAVEQYKAESNKRIQALEEEYERLKALKPYEEMSLEEYCDLLPEKKMFTYKGRPSFWPHTEDEQSLQPPVVGYGHENGDGHGKGGDDGDDDAGKPPKGDGTAGGSDKPPSGDHATKTIKAESKTNEMAGKDAEIVNVVQSQDANTPKQSVISNNPEDQKKKSVPNNLEDENKQTILNNLEDDLSTESIEKQIERALVYTPFQETPRQEKHKEIGKK